jgi:hypothetical protein
VINIKHDYVQWALISFRAPDFASQRLFHKSSVIQASQRIEDGLAA